MATTLLASWPRWSCRCYVTGHHAFLHWSSGIAALFNSSCSMLPSLRPDCFSSSYSKTHAGHDVMPGGPFLPSIKRLLTFHSVSLTLLSETPCQDLS